MIRSYLYRLMRFLKKYIGIVGFCVFSACLTVWFFGSRLKIGQNRPLADTDTRVNIIIIILVLYALYLVTLFVYRWLKRPKPTKNVEEIFDPAKEEIQELEDSFQQLKTILRKNWDGKGSRKYKYGLPWYLIIGQSKIGKTNLITRSGLKFPLAHLFGKDTIREAGETDNFDWWVTDDALIVDSAGHFVTADPKDTELDKDISRKVWHHFIKMVKKFRPRRPLNGIIIAIDSKALTEHSEDKRVQHAAHIHHRISELIEQLGTKLAIYVVVTRLDLMQGFSETFNSLSPQDRESILGFSFDLAENMKKPNHWKQELDQQFSLLLKRISQKNVERFSGINKVEVKHNMWSFHRQLSGMKSNLNEFLDLALSGDRYSTPPLVRGVFLTSTKQENVPINAWQDAISSRYGLDEPVRTSYKGSSKVWFAQRLFQDAIFKEAGVAGNNLRVEAAQKSMAWILALSASAFFVFIGFGWWHSYQNNIDRAEAVYAYIQSQPTYTQTEDFDPTGANLLDEMNALREGTLPFIGHQNRSSISAAVSLYQGKKVGPIADETYIEFLGKGFLSELAKGIAINIEDNPNKTSDERLRDLQVYLMLGDEQLREKALVTSYMAEKWSVAYKQDEELQQQLMTHLDYALDHAKSEYVNLDSDLIKKTQADLRLLSLSDRIYNEIKEVSLVDLPNATNLRAQIGSSFDVIYQHKKISENEQGIRIFDDSAYTIPQIFTKKAFHDYFIPRNDETSKIASKYLYILGLKDKDTPLSDADIEELKAQVRSLYVSDYINSWEKALFNLDIRDFPNLLEAGNILDTVNGVTSPLTRLSNLVVRETTLYDEAEEKELKRQAETLDKAQEKDGTALAKSSLVRTVDPYRIEGLRINRHFAPWRTLIESGNNDQAPYIEEAYKSLATLSGYMKVINTAQNPNADALKKSLQRIRLEGEDPIYVVHRVADGMPGPLKNQFNKLAAQSWKVMLYASSEEMERLWENQVLAYWNQYLGHKYPFQEASKDDVLLEDLDTFFAPKGILNQFWDENLSPFLDKATHEPMIIDGYSIDVSDEFVKNLRGAKEISNLFFGKDGALNVVFNLTPIDMGNGIKRSVMNVEGQLVPYAHDAKLPTNIVWPNNVNDRPSVRLDLFTKANRNISRSYQGSWAWYRMFNSAELSDIRDTSARITFNVGNEHAYVAYLMNVERGSGVLLRGSLSNFSLEAGFGRQGQQSLSTSE